MAHNELYENPSLAILETIYRGLHAAMTRDPALRDSLVLFLPYYINYENDGYHVKLIHPERLGLTYSREDAKKFFDDNKEIIENAVAQGRSPSSIAHASVAAINKLARAGARIDEVHNGRIQYRVLIAQSGATPQASSVDEYDVTGSCPHLYPALGVLCQFDGKAIGMVSMDFDDQLCEKVEAAFNSFMEPYGELSLWRELSGESLVQYFNRAKIDGSWAKEGQPLHSGFENEAEANVAISEIGRGLTQAENDKLRRIVNWTADLAQKHKLLESFQRPTAFVPALWVALTSDVENSVPEVLLETHFKEIGIDETYEPQFRKICVAGGKVYGEWAWIDCVWLTPNWLMLKGKSDNPPLDVAKKLLKSRRQGGGGFTETLWHLAEEIADTWNTHFHPLVEVRLVNDPSSDSTAALNSCQEKTPVVVILGGDKCMHVAVRARWNEK